MGFDPPRPREAPFEAPRENPAITPERLHRVETVRHGAKQGAELSERGREQAREKAQELAERILRAPRGSVFATVSSNIGRAVETARTVEQELRKLLAGSGVRFVDVHDRQGITSARESARDTCVVTNLQPQHAIGYRSDTDLVRTMSDVAALLGNDDALATMAWVVGSGDRAAFEAAVRERFPDVDPSTIDPRAFGVTPEEVALRHLRFMRRLIEIGEQQFPGREITLLEVGHNQFLDVATFALLGRRLTVETVQHFQTMRDPMEADETTILEGGEVETRYRGASRVTSGGLDAVIERLVRENAARRVGWKLEELLSD